MKGGCLTFIVAGIIGMLAAGYVAGRIAVAFSSPADKVFAGQIAILAGIDALAVALLAYFATWYGIETKRHNPAIKVIGVFIGLGALCGQGYGLAWLYGSGALNGILGVLVWLVLIRPLPDPPPISNP